MATTLTYMGNRNTNSNDKMEYAADIRRIWATSDALYSGDRKIDLNRKSEYLGDIKRSWFAGGLVFPGNRQTSSNEKAEAAGDLRRVWVSGGLIYNGSRRIDGNTHTEYAGDLFRIIYITLEKKTSQSYITRRILQPPGVPWLQGEITTAAWCWKLNLQDGRVMGFTNHDQLLVVNGVAYEPQSGFEPTAVATTNDMATDNLDVNGMLDSERIQTQEIAQGKFDFAEVEIFLCNWNRVTDPVLLLRKGTLGRISHGKHGFQAEIRGLLEAFQQTSGKLYQKQCRAQFGDGKCGLNKAMYTFAGAITALSPDGAFFTNLTQPDDYFTYGIIAFSRTGEEMEIKHYANNGGKVSPFLPVSAMAVGDTFLITAGCDGNFSTCKSRFQNGSRFRGEPFIPGNDLMASYPGKQDAVTVSAWRAKNPKNLRWGGGS